MFSAQFQALIEFSSTTEAELAKVVRLLFLAKIKTASSGPHSDVGHLRTLLTLHVVVQNLSEVQSNLGYPDLWGLGWIVSISKSLHNQKYEPRTKLNNSEKREGNVLFHLQREIRSDLFPEAKQNNSVHAKVSSHNLKEKSFATEHKRWLIYIHEKLGPELG